MNGLEISRTFFMEWGLPFLQRNFPELVNRVAGGLFRGSQVLGADDELSRDHGWGPMFVLVLTDTDFIANGDKIKQAIEANAPRMWNDIKLRGGVKHGVQIYSIISFFKDWLGFDQPPVQLHPWLNGPVFQIGALENELYLIRHGSIFHDPLGEFSARCDTFKYYPEPVRLKRICDEVQKVWHYGQYNFTDRLSKRQEPVSKLIALGHFMEAVMRVCMLLEHDYTPYWKWLAFEFRKQPVAPVLAPKLESLAASKTLDEQIKLVREISDSVHGFLEKNHLSSDDLSWHPHSLFCDLKTMKERIKHYQLTPPIT